MSSAGKCRECGAELAAGGPTGLCAKCLLMLGLEQGQSLSDAATAAADSQSKPEQQAAELLQSPTEAAKRATVNTPVLTEKPGDKIGSYKLLEQIGQGGFGVVYMAVQKEPVKRRVALKIIKLGMDTKQVVARFEAERQALALMDHPNIAKILEAGATETGRPYFVMELVHGIKVTDYCDQNNLSTQARLDLFVQICRAVQHAHQKGIIHRDLKPSNILVTLHDAVPVPKIIDFGIAKATGQELTEKTVFTQFGHFIGTPSYMSPEQAQLSGLDVDTRSDIYSLGVLLYELLTGKTPFDVKELLGAGLEEMRRIIREKEPTRPSTRLSTLLEGELTTTAQHRRVEPPKLVKLLRGDLDWIVMKCLEKDRGRRYETANGLARDIERHLSNEPVVACPPSNLYRFHKLVRRNKTAFAAATVVAVVLVIGVAVSTSQAIRATKAKGQALAEKRRADEEAAKQEAINRFLNDMLASADPDSLSPRDQTKGPNITMMQVLDAAAREVAAGSLKDRPAIEAAICQTLGRAYLSLDQAAAAEPLLHKALELNRRIYGELSEPAIGSLEDMSRARGERGKLDEAEQLARAAIEMERNLHGNEHQDVARGLILLAGLLDGQARGQHDPRTIAETETTYREALAMQRKLLPAQSPDLIQTLTCLAEFVMDFRSGNVEAEGLLWEALQIQTNVRGQRHPNTASVLRTLAGVLCNKKDYVEAERLSRQALAIQRELLGTNNPALRHSLCRLGLVLQQEHKLSEAEEAFREALAFNRQAIPRGLDVAWGLKMLAENLAAQERFAEAEVLYREGTQIWEMIRGGGVGHEDYWLHLDGLAKALKSQNKLDEVEALYRDVLARQRKALGDTHVAVPATLCVLGDFLVSRDKAGQATELYNEVSDIIPRLGPAHNHAATLRLVSSLRSKGKAADLEKLYEKLVQVESQNPENPNFFLGQLLQDFGDMLGKQNKFEGAAEQYLKALPIRLINQDQNLAWTLRSLGNVQIECSRAKEAELYLRESLQLCRALNPREDLYCTAWPTLRLADALYQQEKLPEAVQTYRDALAAYRICEAVGEYGFREAVRCLVELLTSEGKLPEMQSVLNEVLTQERQRFGDKDVRTAATLIALARCLKFQSKQDRAADCYREALDIIVSSPPENLLYLPPAAIAEMIDAGLEREAREIYVRVSALSPAAPTEASWLNAASWFLILVEKPTGLDPALALQLARKAAELPPADYYHQNTLGAALGAALYRAGDLHRAVIELEQASVHDEGNYRCGDLLFLAMAHQRLGNTELARRTYKHAVGWMTDHSPCHRLLVRLRAEAETLFRPRRLKVIPPFRDWPAPAAQAEPVALRTTTRRFRRGAEAVGLLV